MKRSYKLFSFGVAALSCGVAAPALAATDSTEFSVTVNPYLNVTLSSADVHLPITPSSAGTYDDTSFTATSSTNSAYGYKLNLSIKDTNTAAAQLTTNLTSDTININDGSTPLIPTFSTNDVLTSAQFSASTSTDHINHWAMSLNDTDHYKAVLSESTIATSNGPVADDVTTMNLATKLDLLTPPGHYSAYFNFEIVANPMPPENNPINNAMGAAEKNPVPIGGESYYKMQDMNATICANIALPAVDSATGYPTGKLVDIRDNTIYTVAKLPDGKCWLLDNLALDLTNTSVKNAMNTSNTNADANSLTSLKSGNRAAGLQYANMGIAEWTSGYGYDRPQIVTGEKNNYYTGNNGGGLDNAGHWKYGIYYNYCAATAGSFCYGEETSSGNPVGKDDTAIDIDSDICPAGWRMPTGGKTPAEGGEANGGEFYNLYSQFSQSSDQYTDFRNALHATLSGYASPAVSYQGSEGYIWSSTFDPDNPYTSAAFNLYVGSSNINAKDSRGVVSGYSVRCIAK